MYIVCYEFTKYELLHVDGLIAESVDHCTGIPEKMGLDKNVNVIYLPKKHQRALGTRSKVSVHSRSNWNLKMLVFVRGRKTGVPGEKHSGREPTTNSTHILVGG